MAAVRVTALVTKAMVGSLIWVAAWTMPTITPTASMVNSSGPPTQRATSRPRRSSVRASSGLMGEEDARLVPPGGGGPPALAVAVAGASAVAVALAVAVAVAVVSPLPLERTEHRSGDGGFRGPHV